ncbi:MAG: hypothetical protein R6T87_06195 [Marinobacter sp.]
MNEVKAGGFEKVENIQKIGFCPVQVIGFKMNHAGQMPGEKMLDTAFFFRIKLF